MILFSARRRGEREAAERVYAACVQAARRPALYLDCGVPDTLQGRFEMLALHLFAVLHRLMHDPGDDRRLARRVSESFVADMDAAFREMGVGDLSVPKRIKTLYRSFAGRVDAYKRALENGDEALVSALARNIFPDGAEDRHAWRLAVYLRAAVDQVRSAELARLTRGDVPFPDPVPSGREEPSR